MCANIRRLYRAGVKRGTELDGRDASELSSSVGASDAFIGLKLPTIAPAR
jgi:hypothetical protein